MTILKILIQLAATNSRTEKEAILREHKDDEVLKETFRLAYNNQVVFWTKTVPSVLNWGSSPDRIDISSAYQFLIYHICPGKVRGQALEGALESLFEKLSSEDADVVARVILKDLRCGCTDSTANKIWPGLVPSMDFMLAETDAKKIVWPAISQIKEDGTRGKFIFNGTNVTVFSRNGNVIETHGTFDRWAQERLKAGDVLDGELVCFKDGKRLPRKDSNGFVNKAVRGTISKEEADMLVFIVWDIETRPNDDYHTRYTELEKFDNFLGNLDDKDKVVVVETRWVYDQSEAKAHFREARARGLEGTILKNIAALWQPKRSYDVVKYKAEYEGEFKVLGVEEGTGKNVGRLGALRVATEDELVKCNVGIFKDFDDSIRDEWFTNPPKIVTIMYNERITSDGNTVESLFLPRVTAARYDKDVANTRDELIEQEKNVA